MKPQEYIAQAKAAYGNDYVKRQPMISVGVENNINGRMERRPILDKEKDPVMVFPSKRALRRSDGVVQVEIKHYLENGFVFYDESVVPNIAKVDGKVDIAAIKAAAKAEALAELKAEQEKAAAEAAAKVEVEVPAIAKEEPTADESESEDETDGSDETDAPKKRSRSVKK